ncbi:MAG TPA: DCC1-like thiol-disulfide oxidoreductase family protein [Polyangia bacterium]|nr:DCC1-like thiol-disulfide oxidoreductase family protein [Polyangia bacterium]
MVDRVDGAGPRPARSSREVEGTFPGVLSDHLRATYLRLDNRSLGLGRIVLGVVLLVDLLRRVPLIRDFYSNLGLLPNHTVLWRPVATRMFSFLFMASLPEESALWFLIAFVCFLCFTVGYRTRLFQVLSLALTVSLHERTLYAENFGTVVLAELLIWTLFLPLGRRFSVDALRASLRARPGETPEDLAAGPPEPDARETTSLAVLGLLLQIAVIYGFNYAYKSGPTWRDGTAVHYVLWQDRIVTWLGLQLRSHAPFAVTRFLSRATLAIEGLTPILVLTPLFWRWTRFAAALLLAGLHVGIALLVNLGIFSPAMMALLPFLLTGAQWRLFARLVPRKGRARTVIYDADCGVCWAVVRVLARMDVHRRLTWVASARAAALPAGVDAALLERTILVFDPVEDRRWTRADGFAQIFAALPLGRLWSWPMRLPGIRGLANRGYDAFARNRTAISSFFGLAACGVPPAGSRAAPAAKAAAPARAPLREWFARQAPVARELGAALVVLVFGAEVLATNPLLLPKALQLQHRPDWMEAATTYANLRQNWGLFAPDAPLEEQTVVFDAVTREGRHVDPFNEAFGRVAAVPTDDVPARLGYASLVFDYALKIPDTGVYHQALIEWMLHYPDRTGHPGDEIVGFRAYVVQHGSPRPGETAPSVPNKRLFLRWP